MRTVNDPGFKHIFCLIHVEKLSYQISDQALSTLSKHSQEKKGVQLEFHALEIDYTTAVDTYLYLYFCRL